jgi:Fur family ferric uptake transcriptional regulator
MDFIELLKDYGLSRTEGRLSLLQALFEADIPMSEKEIERIMPDKINRTTIYRNLNSLSEKGIIQRILSDEAIKYKLNLKHLQNNEQEHVHFQCRLCNRVICMEELKVQEYKLPEGYDKIENQFLIVGICKDCNEK